MAVDKMYSSPTERGNALLGTKIKSTTFLQVKCKTSFWQKSTKNAFRAPNLHDIGDVMYSLETLYIWKLLKE